MKKQRARILIICIFICSLVIVGCGGNKGEMDGTQSSMSVDAGAGVRDGVANTQEAKDMEGAGFSAGMDEKGDVLEAAGETASNSGGGDSPGESGEDGASTLNDVPQDTKIIYTYNYSVETKEFDSFTGKIEKKVLGLGGYVENSETNGSASDGFDRHASMVLRVPAEKMNQLVSLLDTESNVTYSSRSSQNVTLQYVDMESHLIALRTEQKTLLRLIDKAQKLEDVIALQSQLTQVRYEIESYESKLRMLSNQVDYSTVYLEISEVNRTTTITSTQASFTEEVKNMFSDNLYAVGRWLRSLAIGILGSLPILVPLAAFAAVVLFAIRKRVKRRREDMPEGYASTGMGNGYQSIYQKKADSDKPGDIDGEKDGNAGAGD